LSWTTYVDPAGILPGMRARWAPFVLLALLAGCMSHADVAATGALAGTSWTAKAPGSEPRYSFTELQFGSKISPIGLGEVRIAPGRDEVTWFAVRDDVVYLRLYGKPEPFVFDIKGNVLHLQHLSTRSLRSFGVQTFTRAPGVSFSE
jgi:hypothetical protein